jgi:putative ABC transport system ATP-binding protein
MPPLTPNQPLLLVRGLRHSFREGQERREVINDLDFEVSPGECVALLGQSGSGKSTLLHLIGGLDRPDGGEIKINGESLTALGEPDRTLFRRRHLGFIYQFFNLVPTLTVEENVLLPLELNGKLQGPWRDRTMALMHEIGLGNRSASYPDRLSGGEQQRVAIVRALAHDPLLVLADEPTGNLDTKTGEQVLQVLDRLVRQAGKTLVVVTHAKEIAEFADRALWLEDGKLGRGTQQTQV